MAHATDVLRYLCGGKIRIANTMSAMLFEQKVALHTPKLLSAGLIQYAPRWSGYKATEAGLALLRA